MNSHAKIIAAYPDHLVSAIIADLGGRNLRDYKDPAVRWCGERVKAARAEAKRRKGLTK